MWAGLALGLYVLVISLSGSAIVFRQELNRALCQRDGYVCEPPFVTWVARLHGELLGGWTGMMWNGVGAIAVAVMCLTGAVLWWTGKGGWWQRVSIRRNSSRRRLFRDLHNMLGFWFFLLLVLWASTGIYFAFPDIINLPTSWLLRTRAARRPHPCSCSTRLRHSRPAFRSHLRSLREDTLGRAWASPGGSLRYGCFDVVEGSRTTTGPKLMKLQHPLPLVVRSSNSQFTSSVSCPFWTHAITTTPFSTRRSSASLALHRRPFDTGTAPFTRLPADREFWSASGCSLWLPLLGLSIQGKRLSQHRETGLVTR